MKIFSHETLRSNHESSLTLFVKPECDRYNCSHIPKYYIKNDNICDYVLYAVVYKTYSNFFFSKLWNFNNIYPHPMPKPDIKPNVKYNISTELLIADSTNPIAAITPPTIVITRHPYRSTIFEIIGPAINGTDK